MLHAALESKGSIAVSSSSNTFSLPPNSRPRPLLRGLTLKVPLTLDSAKPAGQGVGKAAALHAEKRVAAKDSPKQLRRRYGSVERLNLTALKEQRKRKREQWQTVRLTAEQNQDQSKRLHVVRDLLRQLKRRDVRSERRNEASFNIITNRTVDYFNLTNYQQSRHFKKANDIIEEDPPVNLKRSPSTNEKYSYSSTKQYPFLSYSFKQSPAIRELYFLFRHSIDWTASIA